MTTGLLGPNGKPISSSSFAKAPTKGGSPIVGEAFGPWAGRDLQYMNMPGAGVVQFDLSKLTLSEFRQMSSHYQVNSSISVLMFMLHQLDWHIECEDARIAEHVSQNLENIWTRLVRAMSQAFWAGYSPCILQWENVGNSVQLTKIKDLIPEEASVNWHVVEGTLPPGTDVGTKPPKIKVFDGIKRTGIPYPVPVSNSFWYPLLMENGDFGGRKVLKPAFQPWFFSTLMHLFSNRYFERFGEPVPVGRAPLGDTVDVDGKSVDATDYMGGLITNLRSRSVVVLPSDRAGDISGDRTNNYEYDIEYLESQMRGADFERYMMRLDEEISLALFTPLLLMRTADVGSYNLGVSHMQMYLWQLNALAGDWAEYINKYIIAPMAYYNFGPNAKVAKIRFHKMGKTQAETTQAVITQLVKDGKIGVDLTELGQATGLTLSEIDGLNGSDSTNSKQFASAIDPSVIQDDINPALADKIVARVAPQAARAHARGGLTAGWMPDFGFTSQLGTQKVEILKAWHKEATGSGGFASDDLYMNELSNVIKSIVE